MKAQLFCCKLITAPLVLLSLAGCATQQLTPEQERTMHEVVQQSLRNNQDALEQQQQEIRQRQRDRQSRILNCTSSGVGNTVYTNCQ